MHKKPAALKKRKPAHPEDDHPSPKGSRLAIPKDNDDPKEPSEDGGLKLPWRVELN